MNVADLVPLASCSPLPQRPWFLSLRSQAPGQILPSVSQTLKHIQPAYSSQLPLRQSLGPSLTNVLEPLSSCLLGSKGSAQHLAWMVGLEIHSAVYKRALGLSWSGEGGLGQLAHPFGMSALASHAVCFSFEVARPDSRSDQCTNTHPGHTPCPQPHNCPYIQQQILIHKPVEWPGYLTLTKNLHVGEQDSSAVKSSCYQA